MAVTIDGTTGITAPAIDVATPLAVADIPSLPASQITSGTVATARLGSGTANNTTFLRGDQTWATADIPTVSAGTSYQFFSPPLYSDFSQTYGPGVLGATMAKVLMVRALCSGTIRVQWGMNSGAGTGTHYSRVYKNGVAQSTERSASSATEAMTYYTDDISVAHGDTIEIWGRHSSAGGHMYVYGINLGASTYTGYVLATPAVMYRVVQSGTAAKNGWGILSFGGF